MSEPKPELAKAGDDLSVQLPAAMLLLVIMVVATGFIIITLFDGYNAELNKFDSFRNLMLGLAGLIGAPFGFYLSWKRTSAMEAQTETANEQAKIAATQAKTFARQVEQAALKHEEDADLATKRHEAESFGRAIEQLGKIDSPSIQLGGVYALEALAKSSETLHGPIIETLSAYIRENCDIDKNPEPTELDIVAQAVFTVILRRDPNNDPEDFKIDLRHTDLFRARAYRGNLKNAKLHRARLDQANLIAANIKGAVFFMSSLRNTELFGVKFNKETDVQGADLSGAEDLPEDFRKTVKSNDKTIWPDGTTNKDNPAK